MSTDHTILRVHRLPGTGGPFNPLGFPATIGPLGEAIAELELKAEVANLTDAEILDVAADPTVAAIAPVMKTRLIRPAEEQAVAGAAAASAWGVEAVGAATSPFDGTGIKVAILDTGIDRAHAAFTGVAFDEKDFTGEGTGDGHGHGTHCAGTVFGRDVGGARIGIARGVTSALIGKVLTSSGSGQSDWIYKAILWAAENGARVVSMSLGIDFPGVVDDLVNNQGKPVAAATSIALRQYAANLRAFDSLTAHLRARLAFEKGCVVVAASGNESERPQFTIAASLPAETVDIVSVGAVGQSGAGFAVATFSNTFPQVVGPGVGIVSARRGTTDGFATMSGTSMATPHVAGIAALWWQKLGAVANATTVARRLIDRASLAGFAAPIDPADVGTGLVQAPT